MPPAGASAHSRTTAASVSGSAGWTCQNTPGESRHSRPAARCTTGPSSADMDHAVGVGGHLDLGRRGRVVAALEHRRQHAGRGQRAVGDRQHVVAAVRAQPGPAVGVHGQPHPVPPAQRAAGQLLDRHRPLDPGQPAQLLGQHRRLPARAARPGRRAAGRSRRSRRPGPSRSGAGTRCGAAASTATASARQNEPPPSSLTTARTRSPGSACRTNTTRPSERATQCPPCATGPTSSSRIRSVQSSVSRVTSGAIRARPATWAAASPAAVAAGSAGRPARSRAGSSPAASPGGAAPPAPRTPAARARW